MLEYEAHLQEYLHSAERKQALYDRLNEARTALKAPNATKYQLYQAKLSLRHFEKLLDEATDSRNPA